MENGVIVLQRITAQGCIKISVGLMLTMDAPQRRRVWGYDTGKGCHPRRQCFLSYLFLFLGLEMSIRLPFWWTCNRLKISS